MAHAHAHAGGHLFDLTDEHKKLLISFQDSVRNEYDLHRKKIVELRAKYEEQVRAKRESNETKSAADSSNHSSSPTSASSSSHSSFASLANSSLAYSSNPHLYNASSPFYSSESNIELAIEWRAECLRFLRGRKWKLEDAKTRYLEFLKFRQEKNLDFIVDFHELFVNWTRVLLIRKCCPSAVFGTGKNGGPIYWEKSGKVLVAPILKMFPDVEEIVNIHLVVMEEMVRVTAIENRKRRAEALAAAGLTVDTVKDVDSFPKYAHFETFYNFLDLKGMNSETKKATKFTKAILDVDERYYPERMEKLFAVNTPWIFPIIWNIVKPWVDPHTRTKINIIKSNFLPALQKEFDDSIIPEDFGGKAKCPSLSEEFFPEIMKDYKNENTDLELTTEKIGAGSKVVKTLQGHPGAIFGYYFQLVGAKSDINFSVEFVSDKNEEKVIVVEPARVGLDEIAQSGSYTATDAGTIRFIFDNSFSWLSGKEIKYNFTVGDIDAE